MDETMIDVAGLYAALDAQRKTRELSWRGLAEQLDLSPSTFSRMAQGRKPDLEAFAKSVDWLGMPAETFMGRRSSDREPELAAELAPLLRARKDLTPEDVEYLEDLILATVRRFQSQSHPSR